MMTGRVANVRSGPQRSRAAWPLRDIARWPFRTSMALVGALVCRGPALAYDLNDKLSIGGVLAGAGQCQDLSHATADDRCMAALSVQPEVDFHPTKSDQLFFKLGFAAGNGLNEDSPFLILAWAKATIRFWWRVHRLTF